MWMYESMGKISNITNSSDPQMINSRVFCGNLNTFTLTKDDVESIFKRYGRIIGISMHKGYAFVQYTNEYDARNAVAGEDQRIYAGQPVDVNMASEPKPNRPSRKRPQGAGSEWDYYYNAPTVHPGPGLIHRDSQLAPPFLKRPHHELLDLELDDFTPVAPRGLVPPPLKRPRPELLPQIKMPTQLKRNLVPLHANAAAMMKAGRILVPRLRTGGKVKTAVPIKVIPRPSENPGEYESPDILICGNCKQTFSDLEKLLTHKQTKCKLRFLCKCNEDSIKHIKSERGEPATLSCATCQSDFSSCWDLCQHAQTAHGLQIYVNPNANHKCENSSSGKEENESTNDDKASQNLDDGEAGSSDVATEGDGEIMGLTPDGTAIIFTEDDLDETVSLETEEDAEVSTIKSTDSADVKENCDSEAAMGSETLSETSNAIPTTNTAETSMIDAE